MLSLLLLLLWGTSQSKVALANARDLSVVKSEGKSDGDSLEAENP